MAQINLNAIPSLIVVLSCEQFFEIWNKNINKFNHCVCTLCHYDIYISILVLVYCRVRDENWFSSIVCVAQYTH